LSRCKKEKTHLFIHHSLQSQHGVHGHLPESCHLLEFSVSEQSDNNNVMSISYDSDMTLGKKRKERQQKFNIAPI
jgi:hypothetical protein